MTPTSDRAIQGRGERVRVTLLAVIAALFLIAAERPPARPIPDLDAVQGKWEGPITLTFGVFTMTMVISAEGTYEGAIRGLTPIGGEMSVQDGRLHYVSDSGRTGVIVLHEDAGGRRLVGRTSLGEPYELFPVAR